VRAAGSNGSAGRAGKVRGALQLGLVEQAQGAGAAAQRAMAARRQPGQHFATNTPPPRAPPPAGPAAAAAAPAPTEAFK
jgi:hypothetical protein